MGVWLEILERNAARRQQPYDKENTMNTSRMPKLNSRKAELEEIHKRMVQFVEDVRFTPAPPEPEEVVFAENLIFDMEFLLVFRKDFLKEFSKADIDASLGKKIRSIRAVFDGKYSYTFKIDYEEIV